MRHLCGIFVMNLYGGTSSEVVLMHQSSFSNITCASSMRTTMSKFKTVREVGWDVAEILVWQAPLAIKFLILPPTEDAETWIKFASLCRKSGRISQACSSLIKLLQAWDIYRH
ncbi:hypothetical protein ACS0TY_033977 [Phlomoides rotata]